MNKKPMILRSYHFPEPLDRELAELARKTKDSKARIVRKAVRHYLGHYNEPQKETEQ